MRSVPFADLALLGVARCSLLLLPPLRAHGLMLRLGRCFAPIENRTDALRLARTLVGHGSCLSRSLVVAARVPRGDVVIAVDPKRPGRLFAHAWVEMDGEPIDPSDVAGTVIARLP